MEKRYQVFVSSTFQDLQEERQEVMQALLELDCIPAGMELFLAADEDQWSLIQKVIDECDYYVLILGGRYGSIGPTGLSYTEMEYRYALEKEKPIIAFIHKNPDAIPAGQSEKDPSSMVLLSNFREIVQQKMCKYWGTPAELGSVVSRSLIRLIKDKPAIGWVRADQLPSEDTTSELLRLRKRIEELEHELDSVSKQPPTGVDQLAQGNDSYSFNYSYCQKEEIFDEWLGMEVPRDVTYKEVFETTWNELFSAISPAMIDEASEDKLIHELSHFVKNKETDRLGKLHVHYEKGFYNFQVDSSDFHTIKVQLIALGLIKKSLKQRSVRDVASYLTLTPYGETLMTQLRAIRRKK